MGQTHMFCVCLPLFYIAAHAVAFLCSVSLSLPFHPLFTLSPCATFAFTLSLRDFLKSLQRNDPVQCREAGFPCSREEISQIRAGSGFLECRYVQIAP